MRKKERKKKEKKRFALRPKTLYTMLFFFVCNFHENSTVIF